MKNVAQYDAILVDKPPALLESNQVQASKELQRQDSILIGRLKRESVFVYDNGLPDLEL